MQTGGTHDERREQGTIALPGLLVILICLIGVPLLIYWMLQSAIDALHPFSAKVNAATGQALGFGIGSLFHLTCLIGGLLSDPIRAVLFRMSEFVQNLRVSIPFAFSCYWDDMKSDGVVLLICMVIILGCAYLAVDGVNQFIAIWY